MMFALAMLATAVEADARPRVPVLRQLTAITEGSIEGLRLQGQRRKTLVFLSDGDVLATGSTPGFPELYEIDVRTGVARKAFEAGGARLRDPTRPTDPDDLERWPPFVAFTSDGDLDPAADNSDGNEELFVWIPSTGEVRQLTFTAPPVSNRQAFTSDTGRCIVFTSDGDLDSPGPQDPSLADPGWSNPDGSREVFLYLLNESEGSPTGGTFTQVSNGPAGTASDAPVVGGYTEPRQCQSVAWRSDHDQLGGARSGIHHYVYTTASGKLEDLTARHGLPDGPPDGIYGPAAITGASNFARGPFLVFTTDLDLMNNGAAATNIFRYRIFHPAFNQVVDLPDTKAARDPVVTDGGGHVAFRSDAEFLVKGRKGAKPPFNADGNEEIFLLRGRRRAFQITQSVDCTNGPPALRSDAARLAFVSDCELISGGNPDGVSQIFLLEYLFRGDPLLEPGACRPELGCCTGPPDCAAVVEGKSRRPRRRNCLDRPSGC